MKKKTLALLINISVIFTFIISIATISIADVGNFESYDYDSGSSWNYDSGSSWNYDSGSDRHYNSNHNKTGSYNTGYDAIFTLLRHIVLDYNYFKKTASLSFYASST